jgi:fluoroacetyl-CoA thioesterase
MRPTLQPGIERVCEGIHERHVIDPQRFNEKVARKIANARPDA